MTALALIDAGGANLGSVRYALERLGVAPRIVRDADELAGADRVIMPGVGAAGPAMELLHARGLYAALRASQVPLLGICLGMQLMYEHSEEGDVACLGLIPGVVRHMQPAPGIRVPHMGWNSLHGVRASPLLAGVEEGARAYFVHSYAAPVTDDTVATSRHGALFTAVVQHGLHAGAQFHPERSAAVGSRILR
ncbi:MAG: imidazole glycerol phosphate synthase subunit HisH, partial [Lysobacteraceae bacterium]